jgi:eukaryotic-like serine/threonine-protein kinase
MGTGDNETFADLDQQPNQNNTLPTLSPSGALPEWVGPYRIVSLLGEGGMGLVYLAEQEQPRRQIALKVIRSGMVSDNLRKRFDIEAQILGRLDHPGIAKIYEAVTDKATAWLAMEYVEGLPLDDWAGGDSDLRTRVQLMVDVCEAVHHAHVKAVIHRDLKPPNILVQPNGRPKVLDFGIARVTDPDDPSLAGQTRVGQIMGTPAYMSPEQALHGAAQVDARSDVYTLGVIGWELLAGKLPYEVKGKPIGVVTQILQEAEPPRLPNAPRDLDTIMRRAMAKDPERRYGSAHELGEDLSAWLEDKPIRARPDSLLDQLKRYARKNKVTAALLATLIVSLPVANLVVYNFYRDAVAARLATDNALALLTQRNERLVLLRADAMVEHDPTAAVAWLNQVGQFEDFDQAWSVSLRAQDHGSAVDLLDGHVDEVRWVQSAGQVVISGSYDGTVRFWDREQRTVQVVDLGAPVNRLARSDDGILASGLENGAVQIWQNRVPGSAFMLHGEAEIAWSPDGLLLAAGDEAGGLVLLDRTGQERARTDLGSGIQGLAFSPDGDELAAATNSGTVWRVNTTTLEANPVGRHADAAIAVAWGPSLASGSRSHDMIIWTEPPALRFHSHEVRAVAWSPDGVLASGDRDGRLYLWKDGREVSRFDGPGVVRHLTFSPDGRWLAASGDDRTVRLIEIATRRQITFRGHNARVRHVAFSLDGRELISASSDTTVRVWAVPQTMALRVGPHDKEVRDVVLTADGLATASADGLVRRLNDSAFFTLRGHSDEVEDLDLLPNGTVVSGSRDGTVRLWSEQREVAVYPWIERIDRVAVSSDGLQIAAASRTHAVPYWRLPDGRSEPLEGHKHRVVDVLFSGKTLASASKIGVVIMWQDGVETGRARLDSEPAAMAAHPLGFAVATHDGNIHVLDESGVVLRTEHVHNGAALALDVNPTGEVLSGGADRRVMLSGHSPPREVGTHHGAVTAVAFVGDRYASGSEEGGVTLWTPRGPFRYGKAAGPITVLRDAGDRLVVGAEDPWVRRWPTTVPTTADAAASHLASLSKVRLDADDFLTGGFSALPGRD